MATRRQTGELAPSHPPRTGRGVRPVYEEFKPLSEWKQQELSQLLLVQLPGFLKEQIKVSIEGNNTLKVHGERMVGGNKWSRFHEEFRIPEESNMKGIRAKFEGGTLTITLPNKISGLLQAGHTKEEAKVTKSEAAPPPGDQLPPKTISTVSEAERINGKGITQEQADGVKQAAEGKGNVESTSAAKIIPGTSELGKIADKEKEIGEKGKESLEADNPIEKTVKEEKEDGEGTDNVHKGKITAFSDITKEKLTTDDVFSGGGGGGGGGGGDEGFILHRYKQAMKGLIANAGNLKEERQLIVNMGMAILVIVAVGAYISYTLGSSSRKTGP